MFTQVSFWEVVKDTFTDPTSFLIIIIVGLWFFFKIKKINSESRARKNMKKALDKLDNFKPTEQETWIGDDSNTGIAIDMDNGKVCLLKRKGDKIDVDVITYNDLLSTKIYVDNEKITETSRTSQIGGALLGRLALGGVGAIIGGLSGKTKTSDSINRIDLLLTINRKDNPTHYINLLDSKRCDTKIGKDHIFYKSSIQRARKLHSLIELLIKKADKEDIKKHKNFENNKKLERVSIADELQKLADLRDKGILTKEEFQKEKSKLLSTTN